METLEELKAIIAGKPDGATIIDIEADGNIDYLYFDEDGENGEMLKSCATKEDAAIAFTDGHIRALSDIERIIELMEVEADIRAALKAANIQNRKLLEKTDNLKEKIKDIGYSYRSIEQERDELKILKFKSFNDEECWIYQGDI